VDDRTGRTQRYRANTRVRERKTIGLFVIGAPFEIYRQSKILMDGLPTRGPRDRIVNARIPISIAGTL